MVKKSLFLIVTCSHTALRSQRNEILLNKWTYIFYSISFSEEKIRMNVKRDIYYLHYTLLLSMRDYGTDKDNWMKSRYCHFVCTVTVFHSWKTYVRNEHTVLLIIQILKLEPDLIIKFCKFPKRYTLPWPVVNSSTIYLSLLTIEKGGIDADAVL